MLKKFIIAIFFVSIGFIFISTTLTDEFEITKNLELFTNIFKEINVNYVDETDPEKMSEDAINAMLQSLDPYSSYIPANEVEQFQAGISGHYAGMGASVIKVNGNSIIREVFKESPAHKAGLKAGDILLKADGIDLKPLEIKDISKIFRGRPGTKIKMEYNRPGIGIKITDILIEEINIENLPYYGILEESIAYIVLTTFTENAGKNIESALTELKSKNKINSIILDLRGNSGGLLYEAINVANVFLEKNSKIVSLSGRDRSQQKIYNTLNRPVDTETPLCILMDENSASASEIVAGAIQDYDRGIVLGDRSFGKGLVQSTINLPYEAILKLTTAKYYLPSGRCIQSTNYQNGQEISVADSLREKFKTLNGRSVLDGAGIIPDISTTNTQLNDLLSNLKSSNIIFEYATEYIQKNKIPEAGKFILDDTTFDTFLSFLEKKNFKRFTETERLLIVFNKEIKKEGFYSSISPLSTDLEQKIQKEKIKKLKLFKKEILNEIESEISLQVHLKKGSIINSLKSDNVLTKATILLQNTSEYNKLLVP